MDLFTGGRVSRFDTPGNYHHPHADVFLFLFIIITSTLIPSRPYLCRVRVCLCRGCCYLSVCVCVCDLLIFLQVAESLDLTRPETTITLMPTLRAADAADKEKPTEKEKASEKGAEKGFDREKSAENEKEKKAQSQKEKEKSAEKEKEKGAEKDKEKGVDKGGGTHAARGAAAPAGGCEQTPGPLRLRVRASVWQLNALEEVDKSLTLYVRRQRSRCILIYIYIHTHIYTYISISIERCVSSIDRSIDLAIYPIYIDLSSYIPIDTYLPSIYHLSIYLAVYLCIRVSVYLSICVRVRVGVAVERAGGSGQVVDALRKAPALQVHISIHPSIYLSIYLYLYLYLYRYLYLVYLYLYLYLSVCLSIYLSIYIYIYISG